MDPSFIIFGAVILPYLAIMSVALYDAATRKEYEIITGLDMLHHRYEG